MSKMPNKKLLTFFFLFFMVTTVIPFTHSIAAEVEYKLLAPIPLEGGATPTGETIPSNYIKGLFILVIAFASVLAVIRIIFAGIKYMSTDAFQNKSEAKGDIQNAIWGLALAMSAWLILNTINPNLTNLNLQIPGLKTGSELEGELGDFIVAPEELGCNDCVLLTENPYSSLNLKSCPSFGCYAKKSLADKLLGLNADLAGQKINWRITETYPPTVKHASLCHQPNNPKTASCVDAAITDRVTPENLKSFLIFASARDLKAVFEIETLREERYWRSQVGFGEQFIKAVRRRSCEAGEDPKLVNGRYTNCCPSNLINNLDDKTCSWITAPHFSIYD
jgi:hypothetical protein